MAPNQDDKGAPVQTPNADLSIIIPNDDLTSTSSSSVNVPEEHSIYEIVELPQPPTLKELIQKYCDCKDVSNITKVKLMVIAVDVGLQHLHHHVPMLTELILDGSVLVSLRDLGCALKNLKILRVNRCGLTALDGTYGFDNLEEIYAAKNQLLDISECYNLVKLKVIDASNNVLKDIQALFFLSLCDNLKELTVTGNENIVSHNDYRKVIKELIPQLEMLDGKEFSFEEKIKAKINNNNNSTAGPSFLPPLERPKSTQSEVNTSKEDSFSVNFPPRALSGSSQGISSARESNLPNLSSVRSHNRTIKGKKVLPEIKKKS
ncbi:uncharacterized protein [Onthophagus taurus]|uniref:uncharacterized protein n=1 Tax=Onthophagus taurus TaxID=166361 RepID=UPI000C1FDCC8|nr:uncharacterized protein LOC111418525 [Onthophagus taurus]